MKKRRFHIWLLLSCAWLIVIFGHSSMPAATSDAESLGFLAVVQTVFPWMTNHLLRKLGHFTEFAVLGVFVTGAFRNAKNFTLFKPLGLCLFTAVCDETLQLFIAGRSGNVRDIWIDFSGALLGTLLTWLVYKLRKR